MAYNIDVLKALLAMDVYNRGESPKVVVGSTTIGEAQVAESSDEILDIPESDSYGFFAQTYTSKEWGQVFHERIKKRTKQTTLLAVDCSRKRQAKPSGQGNPDNTTYRTPS
nr:hypothetical protein [uncultured Pseudodesulfovibrio sp.]